jgi:type III restriction enzyme
VRPFFCRLEAVEALIWLTEVAPNDRAGQAFLDHVANANHDANPELLWIAPARRPSWR